MAYRYAKDANGNRVLFRSATNSAGNKQWFQYDESKVPVETLTALNAPKGFAAKTLSNLPKSIETVGENVINMVKHPIDTASAIGDVAAGALLSIPNSEKLSSNSPESIAQKKAAFSNLIDLYAKRYGSLDAAQNTIETDPAGVLLDATGLASGVSAVKTAGKMAGKALAKVSAPAVRKIVGQASPEVAQLANYAYNEGMRIPVDQILDSRVLSVPAKTLEYVPFSGRRATEAALHKQANMAASRLFGQNDSNFNKALRNSSQYFDTNFEEILGRHDVKLSQNFMNNLANIQNEAAFLPNPRAAGNVARYVDKIVDIADNNGNIKGRQLYLLKQEIDNLAKQPPEYGGVLGGKLRDTIYGAYDESLPAHLTDKFRDLRDEYANFARLKKISTNAVEGDINYRKLSNMRPPFKPGLEELVQTGAQFLAGKDKAGMMYGVIPGLTMASLIASGLPSHVVTMMLAGRGFNNLLNSNTLRNIVLNNPIPLNTRYGGNFGTNASMLYNAANAQNE